MEAVLLGSGNVGTHLGRAIFNSPHKLVQVYNKSKEPGKELAKKLQCEYIQDLKNITETADIYIIAIKDDALEEFIEKMPLVKGIVVHTAGSKPINILEKFKRYGVLYPLQTFSKQRSVSFEKVPLCIEGNTNHNQHELIKLAKELSENVQVINSEKRLTLHIAAVIVCNFSNFLFTVADNFLEEHEIPFDMLKPLIQETVDKIQEKPPEEVQTGPAARGDKKTIEKHLNFLSENEKFGNLYRFVSDMIEEYFNRSDKS